MECMVASEQLTQLIHYLRAETSLVRSRHLLLQYVQTQSGARQVLLFRQHSSSQFVLLEQYGVSAERSEKMDLVSDAGLLGSVLERQAEGERGIVIDMRSQRLHLSGAEQTLLEEYVVLALYAIRTSAQVPRGVLVLCFAAPLPATPVGQVSGSRQTQDVFASELPFLASAELRICLTLLTTYLSDDDTPATPPPLIKRERERIAYDLHDGAVQYLAHALHRLEFIERQLDNMQLQTQVLFSLQGQLREIAVLLTRTLTELRQSISSLLPAQLEQDDLLHALHMLIAEMRTLLPDVEIYADLRDLHRVPLALEGTIFRLVQEALHNIYQHAHASTITLRIYIKAGLLLVEVSDNGIGLFSIEDVEQRQKNARSGLGLRSMRERVEAAGGRWEIESQPGRGTSVRARFALSRSSRGLTIREREILRLVSEGLSNESIAQRLSISRETVKSHVHHIMQKMQVKDRTQAAVLAVQHRWL